MRSFGWSNCADPGGRRRASAIRSRAVLSLALIAPLLAGACETDKEAQRPLERSQAQRDMHDSSERLSEPLEGTMTEATTLGALLGGISIGIGGGSVSSGIATGALYGGLAGRYVVTKQAKYSGDVEVIEAITEDIRDKNRDATRMVEAMELVVAEDRARLAEIRQAVYEGKADEDRLKQQIAVVERDLKTMKSTAAKAEDHAETFRNARAIVLQDSEDPGIRKRPEVKVLDGEIETLRARIRSMHDLIDELSSVS